MKITFKRIISITLALLMVVFCFPVTALGTDEAVPVSEQTETSSPLNTSDALSSETNGLSELTAIPEIVLDGVAEEVGELTRLPLLEKDLYTIAYADTTGKYTMKLFSHPIKFVDDDGKIKDISLEIESTSDGGFQTAANNVITKFPQKFTDGISLEYNNIKVELVPVKAGEGKLMTETISTDNASLSPDKKKVSYSFGNKTRLDYELTYAGFKEDIVVESYTGQTEYNFLIKTNGLALTERNGSYFIEDSKGNVRATIGDIVIFTADERNNTFGSMTHTVVKENQIYAMTVHVDANFLKDEKTVYPIRIDPTIEVNYENNGAGAIHDATVNTKDQISSTSGTLALGKYGSDQSISRVLMRFPGMDFTQYTSAQIVSASVSIRDLQPGTTGTTVSCYRFDGNVWSDGGDLTWNGVNGNAYSNLQSSHAVSYANGNNQTTAYWYDFDITGVAKQWAAGTANQNKGIIFKASDTTEANSAHVYKTFGSYNRASYKPVLTVIYNTPFCGYSTDIAPYEDTDNLQFRANCYGFALRMFLSVEDISSTYSIWGCDLSYIYWELVFKQQPGGFSTGYREEYYNDFSINGIMSRIQSDMTLLGYNVEPLGKLTSDEVPDAETLIGKRLVLLVVGSGDYHFYMQNGDNTWSHKQGEKAASNLSATSKIPLTNENIVQLCTEDGYDKDMCFFYIDKSASVDSMHTVNFYSGLYVEQITDRAGNTFNTAVHLASDTGLYDLGGIDYIGDVDYFSFIPTSSGVQTISFSLEEEFNLNVGLYDSTQTILASQECSDTTECDITYNFTAGQLYYLRVSATGQETYTNDYKYDIYLNN